MQLMTCGLQQEEEEKVYLWRGLNGCIKDKNEWMECCLNEQEKKEEEEWTIEELFVSVGWQ